MYTPLKTKIRGKKGRMNKTLNQKAIAQIKAKYAITKTILEWVKEEIENEKNAFNFEIFDELEGMLKDSIETPFDSRFTDYALLKTIENHFLKGESLLQVMNELRVKENFKPEYDTNLIVSLPLVIKAIDQDKTTLMYQIDELESMKGVCGVKYDEVHIENKKTGNKILALLNKQDNIRKKIAELDQIQKEAKKAQNVIEEWEKEQTPDTIKDFKQAMTLPTGSFSKSLEHYKLIKRIKEL